MALVKCYVNIYVSRVVGPVETPAPTQMMCIPCKLCIHTHTIVCARMVEMCAIDWFNLVAGQHVYDT